MDNLIANQLGSQGPVLAELTTLDLRRIRPLAAIVAAQAAGQAAHPLDVAALAALEDQACQLRARLGG
ncbi:MAG: hypothetical protein HY055_14255 [Magnetospirillum sp.]|nr:hypothetical protein [Magnetospirillum sp.]